MTPEEFDINFDFDNTYGEDPNADKCSFDDDFDLDAALARELGPDFERLFEEEYAASQAALNAQINAAKDMMEATRIRLEIGREDTEEIIEEEEPEEDDGPKEAEEIRENPILGGFMDFDDDDDETPGEEDDDPDEDLSTLFTAATSGRASFFDEEAEPVAEEEPDEDPNEKTGLGALMEKVDFSAIGAGFAAVGAVIRDNARRFTSALKECKPGKMDRKAKRRFKDDVLPVLIGGAALVVCMVFIVGALSRGPSLEERQQAALQESIAQAEAEAKAAAEIEKILNDAAANAMVYDYQAAIDTLDSYKTEERPLTDEMAYARAEYAEAVNNLVIWDDPTAIPNLSFHVLIEDSGRAYADALAGSYKSNFVTTGQFASILEQLYSNSYVLVNLDSCLTKNSGNATVQPVYLPAGKKPIMLTETLVNYFGYMVDGNKDGVPDQDGAGFANKLVLENGEIKASYIDAQGNELIGDYDLVPILNSFISEHPDFSYRGARAILGVTGEEGVFGWRTTGGDEATIAGAKEVVAALRGSGYQIACNSYANLNYGSTSVEEIKADLGSWEKDVKPVLGDVDILVIARGGEMTPGSSRFETAQQAGFRYILDAGTQGSSLENGMFYQNRTMVLGSSISAGEHVSYFTLTSE